MMQNIGAVGGGIMMFVLGSQGTAPLTALKRVSRSSPAVSLPRRNPPMSTHVGLNMSVPPLLAGVFSSTGNRSPRVRDFAVLSLKDYWLQRTIGCRSRRRLSGCIVMNSPVREGNVQPTKQLGGFLSSTVCRTLSAQAIAQCSRQCCRRASSIHERSAGVPRSPTRSALATSRRGQRREDVVPKPQCLGRVCPPYGAFP
jgi:hypothetical protein